MDQETVIGQWYNGVCIMHKAHYEAARQRERGNMLLGIPIVVLSAVAGTSVFATLNSSPDTWMKILIGLFSVLAAVLASLQTFLAYSERAEKHKTAAVKYGILRRELEEALAFHSNDQPFTREFIESFRNKWDALDQESLTIPQKIQDWIVANHKIAAK